jgi:4-hydroxy-tetrahydrodipicolinate synthase
LRVTSIVIEQAKGRVPVIAGTGSNNTAASVEMTKAALEVGADACLAVVPYYNKPNQEGLLLHFAAIEAVGLPVVLYNVPSRTIVSLTAETVERLAGLGGVVAIKEASADLRLDTEIIERCAGKISTLSGDDFTTFPFCTIGGDGCVSVVGNVAPGLMSALVAAGKSGDVETGRGLHAQVCELAELCFSEPNPVPTKVLLNLMGVCEAHVRAPLARISETGMKRLDDAYKRLLAH